MLIEELNEYARRRFKTTISTLIHFHYFCIYIDKNVGRQYRTEFIF